MTNAEMFEKFGCVRLNGFLDPLTLATISQYFENKILRGDWKEETEGDEPITKLFCYADPLIEVVLKTSQSTVEEAVGKELLPTYSYSRIYQPTEELKPHVDRPSCEYSVTVSIANKGGISPIYTQYKDDAAEKHVLSPGDAVIYKGCEAKHWRKPMEAGQLIVQFMLHYVDKNGPHAGYCFDTRPSLGVASSTRTRR